MAFRNYRVGELEIKPNYTSVVRGYNFDSRYYLNDKDSPAEDLADYSGINDPNKFTSGCSVITDGVMYLMPVEYNGSVTHSLGPWQDISSTGIVPQTTQDAVGSAVSRSWLAMIGTPTKISGLNVNLLIQYRTASIGDYISSAGVTMNMPLYLAAAVRVAGIPGTITDTTRAFSSGYSSYPGFMKFMQQSGYWAWTAPSGWIKGLDDCYNPVNISHGEGGSWQYRPMQEQARVPNEANYYWTLISKHLWKYANQSGLSSSFTGASASFTVR